MIRPSDILGVYHGDETIMTSKKPYDPGFLPPVVGARIPRFMTFRERVYWYSVWIENNPYSHIHFQIDGNPKKGFISERHVNL